MKDQKHAAQKKEKTVAGRRNEMQQEQWSRHTQAADMQEQKLAAEMREQEQAAGNRETAEARNGHEGAGTRRLQK